MEIKNIKEWQKDNPHKSVNDYYSLYTQHQVELTSKRTSDLSEPLVHQYSNNKKPSKRVLVSVLLTLLLGPFGLIYSSVTRGLFMIFIPVIGLFIGLILPLICGKIQSDIICLISMTYWAGYFVFLLIYEIICIVLSITTVQAINKKNQTK
tara:strand:- start:1057 stop:1509 length:453 start_codon:yes stop_codon:yes gene_type:complete